MPAPDVSIRQAAPADVGVLLDLIKELAAYEHLAHEVVATEVTLAESLFGDRRTAEAVIADDGGTAVGFALFFHNFSTFVGRPGLYLEDLYVRPSHRRQGIGRRLLQHLAALAVTRGCRRMEWVVLDWNTPAIQTYEHIGATPMRNWRIFRLADDRLTDFARSGGWSTE